MWRGAEPGAAYLGLPMVPDVARALMGRSGGPILHGRGGMVGAVAFGRMRDGVPPGALLDVGHRPD
ncbi:hypothetical protein [Streptomyces sp. DH12]|uniref:hypothetical protein n=1 Tax=Streptomyces sp. DH12 TaxID=2857010 RepID=UPI001E39B0E6|nr:hypothetical protein [Streptomyces sp. DH12]